MCVPLGGRGGGSHGSIKTKISKEEVEEIITGRCGREPQICQWKRSGCSTYSDCDMPLEELVAALNDEATRVSVANTFREEYKRGYRTIVMVAPSIKAKVIFRIVK